MELKPLFIAMTDKKVQAVSRLNSVKWLRFVILLQT